ncbi:hypothetical protein OSCT_0144 [Oscillochloris trichoides DG-6]|uniref:Uncharacterized protein n=1 Tax=Oscillochloris trichoides DG-6 TaxID=765420 RepID=E1I9Z3_9CHLR|nr:hypothetical protein [Oscillochloris trichoides]EFO81995.1 hypothetical protein OSCT_0144 [Oscillochloris trichoides DG-6]
MRRLTVLLATIALVMTAFATPARAQSASMVVTPTSIQQGEYITLTLNGFKAEEVISFWLTLPDYSVDYVGDLVADDGTTIVYIGIPVSMPVGAYSVSARGNTSRLLATGSFEVNAASGRPATPGVSVTVEQELLPQGYCFDFAGEGYAAKEKISVWLRMPDGSVSDDGLETEFLSDADGTFGYYVCFGRLSAEGTYAFTAFGNTSNRTGIVEFELERGDYIEAPNDATLVVIPDQAEQLDVVTIIGTGFLPGEEISLWITLPNGVVLDMFSGITVDGSFQEEITLPPLPVGTHYISAYGHTSGIRAVATLELWPGDGN